VAILFFGNGILALWVGAEYTDIPAAVLWFTAANFFFSTYLWTALNVLMGAGEIRRIFFISVFEVALVLALILALVPTTGLPGLALAGLVGNVLTGLFLFIPAACRLTTVTPRRFVARGLLPMLAAALPGSLAGAGLTAWLGPEGWLETLGAAAITGGVTLLGLLALSTTPRERARYYVTFRRLAGVA
jgi:O-antigen/teichoic acid export membrane protein